MRVVGDKLRNLRHVGYARRLTEAGLVARIEGLKPEFSALLQLVGAREIPLASAPVPAAGLLERTGRRVLRLVEGSYGYLAFVGESSIALLRAIRAPRRLRWRPILHNVQAAGVDALPITGLLSFLMGVVIAYQGADQLQRFGANIFVVDLVALAMLRELSPLLTAIIVAGRSGSAFAAELGAMQLNEEVDALRAMGVEPMEVLVLPRLVGLVIALPLLTLVSDLIGLAGGGLLCHWLLGMPLVQYTNRVIESIASTTFWVGLLKAPVFAVLIALAGTRCGFRVRSSTRELGRLTTLAVVQSIFLVMLAGALFAVLFMELDI